MQHLLCPSAASEVRKSILESDEETYPQPPQRSRDEDLLRLRASAPEILCPPPRQVLKDIRVYLRSIHQ